MNTRMLDGSRISIIRYSPQDRNHLLTGKVVECYRQIFADRPWNEWLKCSLCQKYWGAKDLAELAENNFRHCGVPLADFWPREQVLADLTHEITERSSCWIATDVYDNVVGFCWGYPVTAVELENKLGIRFVDNLGCKADELLAYQDEIAVTLLHRGKSIGKNLMTYRLQDFMAQGLVFGIVRTRKEPEPSVTFKWYTDKLGYKVIGQYPGDDGRVILGRSLEGLHNLVAV